jgi:hypothetical protein
VPPSQEVDTSAARPEEKEVVVDSVLRYNKKVESLNFEYNLTLAQTLENQRAYFERRIADLSVEEGAFVQQRKVEISRQEDELEAIEDLMARLGAQLDEERKRGHGLRHEYGQVMASLLQTELENKRLKQANEQTENFFEAEAKRLKLEVEAAERDVEDLKQERGDLLGHMQMSQKVRKSKNRVELEQAQTLIFETKKKKR